MKTKQSEKAPEVSTTRKRGITARSVIIGFILSAGHTGWLVWAETFSGYFAMPLTTFMLIQSVIAILLFLLIINSILKRTIRRWMFTPAELMVIFSMMTLSTIIAGVDLLQTLLPVLLWPRYYGAPTDGYDKLYGFVPRYFIPQDPLVIKQFFTGSYDMWRFFRPEIFKAWIVPLGFWIVFLFLLAFTMLCLGSILRRQWIDNEKLTFPIIELPLQMAKANTIGEMFKSPLLSLGFFPTVALLLMNGLSTIYPSIPGCHLNITGIGYSIFTTPPLAGMNPIYICWWPCAIGLCYLIPLDISFSCWFFYVFIRLSMAFATAQGWRDPWAGLWAEQFPYFRHITSGAWIGMFIVVMWSARGHLASAWHAAMSAEKMPGDDREPMSYRTAVFGAMIGLLLLIGITIISGVSPHLAILFFTIYFLAIVVMTRIYAQIAVPIFELAYLNSGIFVTDIVGTGGLTRLDAVVLGHYHWFNRTFRQQVMGHEMESYAFAERVEVRNRPMTALVILSLITGIIVGLVTLLQLYYYHGSPMPGWPSPMGVGAEAWSIFNGWTRNPAPPQPYIIISMIFSGLIVLGLAVARNAWFGFPLHPIGYAFASSYAMEYIWNIVLITWLIKTLVVRYGGLKLYRKSLPLFFGLILGDAVMQLTWGLLMTVLGMKSPGPYLEIRW